MGPQAAKFKAFSKTLLLFRQERFPWNGAIGKLLVSSILPSSSRSQNHLAPDISRCTIHLITFRVYSDPIGFVVIGLEQKAIDKMAKLAHEL
jgi:hypothetical protein